MNKLPYVISAELELNNPVTSPYINQGELESYREHLDSDLRSMGKNTYWISSNDITTSLDKITQNTRLPIASLDDRYNVRADQYFGVSRGVNTDLDDEGYVSRRGYPALSNQLQQASNLGKEIMVIDDVLYSGEMITWLNSSLTPTGTRIASLAVGVAMQEGVDKLSAQGIDVQADYIFQAVEDELCERDLAIVPGSGRRIESIDANALYFDFQNGRPEKWASIEPASEKSFCINSLERSLRLIRSNTSMEAIGNFLGYDTVGNASDSILKRLGEIL